MKTLWIIIAIVVIGGVVVLFWGKQPSAVASFEECLAAGYPVMESYPRQCRDKAGNVFVEDIGNELDLTDLIQVDMPRPNDVVKSPLIIKGRARGTWYFEASFPVILRDANHVQLAIKPAQAQGEWMTTEFVPFEVELAFETPATATGTLILQKDNPSGLPENDAELVIPVRFE